MVLEYRVVPKKEGLEKQNIFQTINSDIYNLIFKFRRLKYIRSSHIIITLQMFQARNLPVMLEALAQGANPNWANPEEDSKTPLIKAAESVSSSAISFCTHYPCLPQISRLFFD